MFPFPRSPGLEVDLDFVLQDTEGQPEGGRVQGHGGEVWGLHGELTAAGATTGIVATVSLGYSMWIHEYTILLDTPD